jgi:RNA polymerase sigma factor (sigma-70 family)
MQEEFKAIDILWRQFKEGNQNAFYCLYDQYADSLYKYGSHFSKDKDFIKDCIHDLFLDLFTYRKKLSETDNVQFYLFRSLRRIMHKKQVKVVPFNGDEIIRFQNENLDLSDEDYLIATETEMENLKMLNEAMLTLSERQRKGLSLKFEHDQSYPEIAEIMGISVESSRTIIYRALKELRKCIENKSHSIQLLFFLSRNRDS